MPRAESKRPRDLRWHPDFRNPATLPDVKVVRTDFAVNFLVVFLAVCLLGHISYRQYRIWDLGVRLEMLEQQISERTARNNQNLRLNGEFRRAQGQLTDLAAFYQTRTEPLAFLVEVTERRPDTIALSRVEYAQVTRAVGRNRSETFGRFVVAGMLRGSSAEALDAFDQFRRVVSELEVLEGQVANIQISSPRRNPMLDLFEFNLEISLRPEP